MRNIKPIALSGRLTKQSIIDKITGVYSVNRPVYVVLSFVHIFLLIRSDFGQTSNTSVQSLSTKKGGTKMGGRPA